MNQQALLAIVISYLLGSIPAAYIAGKAKGVDLRKHGSGNLGATNVMRVLGTKIGLAVFLFDMAKGAAPVYFFPKWLAATGALPVDPVVFGILCGIAAIFGHVRPIFLKFGKGGKGVATAAGVFLALAPLQTLLALLVFATVLFASGYVSLGSLTSAVALPILLAATVAFTRRSLRSASPSRCSSSGRTARISLGYVPVRSIASGEKLEVIASAMRRGRRGCMGNGARGFAREQRARDVHLGF